MNDFRSERGQTIVVTVMFLGVLLGMAATVLDVGVWYRADRHAQAAADAAALAGAHALPDDPVLAAAYARDYADKNGGGLAVDGISFPDASTISVEIEREAPGFFSKLFRVDSVTVGAKAAARVGGMSEARWVAPITVSWFNEFMPGGGNPACTPDPCTGPAYETTLSLVDLHSPGSGDAAGAFGLIDLRLGGDGSVGASTLHDWMKTGFTGLMKSKEKYESVPSVMFNSSQFKAGIDTRFKAGDEVLLPVYDAIKKSGSTAQYNIVGWVGFKITSWNAHGNGGTVKGYFQEVFWDGVQAAAGTADDFGARTIQLVD